MRLLLVGFLFSIVSFCFAGNDYWQQKVDYKIAVSLNDKNHTLSAFEEITYVNNSPDELEYIYFHLWPNAYKNNETGLGKQLLKLKKTKLYYNAKKRGGYMDSLHFKVNNKDVKWELNPEYIDIAKVILNSPLKSGDSIKISTPFKVKIPEAGISRMGHNENAYQITQWYPKPAVYDAEGWHRLPYLSIGEFYSEFGSFEVDITLPKNYLIGSTGNMVGESAKEELEYIAKREKYSNLLYTQYPRLNAQKKVEFPILNYESSKERKTLKFVQSNIHDFAWFADKNWMVKSSEVKLPKSLKKVKTYSFFYPQKMKVWEESTNYIDSALYYYSLFVGDYPYETCVAVDGSLSDGEGMEYPNVTVIGNQTSKLLLANVIIHEVGHNWFYGMLGSNERVNPWMDEGLNSYLEKKVLKELYPKVNLGEVIGWNRYKILQELNFPLWTKEPLLTYSYEASRNKDVPANLASGYYSQEQYAAMVYGKSAMLFNYLEKYLGEDKMHRILTKYFKVWKYKHPTPFDFVEICEEVAGTKLSWFFDDLIGTRKKLNYSIKSAGLSYETGRYEVIVKNKGQVNGPLVLSGVLNGKVLKTVWYEGFEGSSVLDFPKGEYDEIYIDYYHDMPEFNRQDNRIQIYYLTGKLEPLEVKIFGDFSKDDKTQIFYTPYVGFTNDDKFILGAAFYNSLEVEKKFRYLLMPGYSFNSNQFSGSANMVYSIYPLKGRLRKLNLNFGFKRFGVDAGTDFGYIQKWEPGVNFIFNQNDKTKSIANNLEVRYTQTTQAIPYYLEHNRYVTAQFNHKNKRVIHPYSFEMNAQLINESSLKTWAEFNYHFTINEKLKTIDIRLYGGVFVFSPQTGSGAKHRFRLTAHNGLEGYTSGMNDYLLDEGYLGRYDGNVSNISAQQIGNGAGGFRSGFNIGTSSSWIGALNVTVPTPLKFLKAYGDLGVHPGAVSANTGEADPPAIQYDAGVQINLVKNKFEVYLPFVFSSEIEANNEFKGADTFWRRIKFKFNISEIYSILQ